MSDSEETIEDIDSTAEEEEAIKAGPKRKFFGPSVIKALIYVAVAIIMIVISGTVAYFVTKKVGSGKVAEKISPQKIIQEKPLSYFALESFSANTSDTDEPHFIKLTLSIGYEESRKEIQTELVKRRAQLRDIVISVIGAKKYVDLNTQEKRENLKKELMYRINDVLIDGKIKAIAFTEFVLT